MTLRQHQGLLPRYGGRWRRRFRYRHMGLISSGCRRDDMRFYSLQLAYDMPHRDGRAARHAKLASPNTAVAYLRTLLPRYFGR